MGRILERKGKNGKRLQDETSWRRDAEGWEIADVEKGVTNRKRQKGSAREGRLRDDPVEEESPAVANRRIDRKGASMPSCLKI